jgi:HEAT repeat protein
VSPFAPRFLCFAIEQPVKLWIHENCMHPILNKLEGGDRRSIGRSNEVVLEVLADPKLFKFVFSGMLANNPLLRMRAADAVEKITALHPEYLRRYKTKLLAQASRIDQKEVRWHVAQMLSRAEWNHREWKRVLDIILDYLNDSSSIVRTFAMQALADLSRQAPEIRPIALAHLQELTAIGSPAMKARGRKLLAGMQELPGAQAQTRSKPRAG